MMNKLLEIDKFRAEILLLALNHYIEDIAASPEIILEARKLDFDISVLLVEYMEEGYVN